MASENKKKTVPATLGLMLLSLSVVSLITISAPNYASAQGSLEGLETEQGGQGESGAQQVDTGAATLNDTATVQAGGDDAEPTACASIQTGGGGQNTTTTTGGGSTTTTTDMNTTSTTAEGEGNQSTSTVRDFIEEACIALQVGDTQGALMQLNSALGELGGGTQGNNTTNTTSGGGEGTFDEGVSVGGTSAFDDYDATADAEAG
ncbi:MAG: hypothetical protein M3M89_03930 [Thermoproteota archaeon]|nr:hypothetical protein [Thermoproteota archaeon]